MLNTFQIQQSDINKAYIEQLNSRKEYQSSGSVNGNVYKSYLSSVNSSVLVTSVIILFIVGQMAISATDLIVSKWSVRKVEYRNENQKKWNCIYQNCFHFRVNWEILNQIEGNFTQRDAMQHRPESIDSNRMNYVYIYTLLIVSTLYLVFQRALALYLFCLKASRRMHEKLLRSVLNATMNFFNTNSSGRIINRFSKDLYDVDYYLALVLYDFTLVIKNL